MTQKQIKESNDLQKQSQNSLNYNIEKSKRNLYIYKKNKPLEILKLSEKD